MRKTLKFLYVLIFIAMLLIPVFTMNNQEDAISDIDNRKLKEAPELWSPGFTDAAEDYLADRIGFRNDLVTGYQVLNDLVAHELVHPSYTYGQDDYVFFSMHDNLSFDDFKVAFADMVVKIRDYCEARGTGFYFMFEPEKSSVLRDYLPDGVNYDDQWVDELIAYLEEQGVVCINNTQLLMEKSETEQVFNRQYDAGHWNDLGCFYATNNLLARIHEDYPQVVPYELDDFTITEKVEQYLTNSEFTVNETVPAFALNIPVSWMSEIYYEEMERNSSYKTVYNCVNEAEGSESLPKTLIFHGSYYNRGPQFLAGWASEYTGVHNYQNVINMDYYYNIVQPDIVVFEVTEYTVSNTYFNYGDMLDIDYNPVLNEGEDTIAYVTEHVESFETETELEVVEGQKIDRVYVERDYAAPQYAYLITDDQVFDLRRGDGNVLWADIPHGAIQSGQEVVVLLQDYDGKQYYSAMEARTARKYTADDMELTQHAEALEGGGYCLTTERKGNRFNALNLQLLSADCSEFLATLDALSDKGTAEGVYIHDLDSGWYTIRLKGNTNLEDEFLECRVWLEQGKKYFYQFSATKLKEKEITIGAFELYGFYPASEGE